jgi:hypothetical protein
VTVVAVGPPSRSPVRALVVQPGSSSIDRSTTCCFCSARRGSGERTERGEDEREMKGGIGVGASRMRGAPPPRKTDGKEMRA